MKVKTKLLTFISFILKTRQNILFYSLFSLHIIIILMIVLSTRKLRPISDDYCLASAAGKGVFPALRDYFLNWSGDLASIFYSVLFTGWPIINFPWSLGSSISFILSSMLVSCMMLYVIYESFKISLKINYKVAFFLIIFFFNSWWASWWVTNSLGVKVESLNFLAHSVTFWQNINSGYVMPTILSVLSLFSLKYINNRALLLSALILGLIVGISGIVVGITFLIFGIILTIALLFMRNYRMRLEHYGYSIFTLGVLLGVLISYLSPGTRRRRAIDGSDFTITDLKSQKIISNILNDSIQEYTLTLFTLNNFFIFILTFTIFNLLRTEFQKLNIDLIKFRVTQIILLIVIYSIANNSAELFNYPAIWHTVPLYIFNYLIIIYLSMYLFDFVVKKSFLPFYKSILVVTFILQLVTLFSITFMINKIEERYAAWNKGSAAIAGIGDLFEKHDHWINVCWSEIGKFRVLPNRQ
jgi:hypothetical protein